MPTSAKTLLITASLGILGLVGLTTTGLANSSQAEILFLTQQINNERSDTELSEEAEDESDDDTITIELQRVAKTSLQKALQIAESSAQGQASSIELEQNEDKVVYVVIIGAKQVSVDAVNGQVVTTEDLSQSSDREDAEEAKEVTSLQRLATTTLLQAVQIAETSLGGQAYAASLENEDSSLVYQVAIGSQEIYVDAGNGQILYTEAADEENETNHPLGSVQIP